jgi:AcrR family transcriptional regulator
MQDILRAAEMSPGAFYGYFASKRELIAALAEEAVAELGTIVEDAAGSGDEREFFSRLIAGVSASVATGRAALAVQVWSEAGRDPVVRALAVDVVEHMVARIADVVGSRARARVIVAVVQGFVLQRALGLPDDGFAAASASVVASRGRPAH